MLTFYHDIHHTYAGTPNRYPCDTAGFLSYSEIKPAPLMDEAGPQLAWADGEQVMLE